MIEYLADFATAMWSLRWWWLAAILAVSGIFVFADDGR